MKNIFAFILLSSNFIFAQSFVPNAPDLNLKSYMLIEPNTNTVIAESNSNGLIEPASMTKVMTAYVVADQIKNDLISLDDTVLISEKAWRMGGSKMFIEVGKRVSILDLLKGIIIQSGNDAAVAIAEYVGGTEEGFVDLMNSYAGVMGMNDTLFINSTGLPDTNHLTSAIDLSILTSNFISNFPDIYALFKEKEFEYGGISGNKYNRNKLLWRDETSDGVKTGHTSSAGYCLIGSAKRGNMRLITVVAGSDTANNSFADTQRLLEYGFRFYATQKYFDANKEYTTAKIWGGKSDNISLGVVNDISITLPRTSFKNVKVNYNVRNNLQAPIKIGDKLGTLEIISNDKIVSTSDLIALENVDSKGFFGRLWSKFVLWVISLFGLD
ncbi:MAG: serine-type D-Ala-D-Ala carboxypeptidase [Gammaproteobacteria bacterium]|nr:serine-type D-Ala-D-Ala carboxypeptidase [Gammaproteobacteria bacterium]|tara:strand:+ start:21456 stop:22604 length:1149 start_codon:yes stop_codon:yes gene_type:complete